MEPDMTPRPPGSPSLTSDASSASTLRKKSIDIIHKPSLLIGNTPTTRNILINSKQKEAFGSNKITTSKYNIFTFVPKFLFQELTKYSNLFFVFIVIIQQIPNVSPTGRYATLMPLSVILSITAIKEIIEEIKRRRSDKSSNNRKVEVLRPTEGKFVTVYWKDVEVGDIVRVNEGQPFPADILLINSSEANCMCCIETSNLDGETHLKIRRGISAMSECTSAKAMGECSGLLQCQLPTKFLYDFVGTTWICEQPLEYIGTHGTNTVEKLNINKRTVSVPKLGQKKVSWYEKHIDFYKDNGALVIPMGPENLLMRGASLKNTKWVLGLVVYTGFDTKLMLSTTKAGFKRTQVEKKSNHYILFLLVILFTGVIMCAGLNELYQAGIATTHLYLYFHETGPAGFWLNCCTYLAIFDNFIPISLPITITVVKFCQAIFINWDKDMYHEPSDKYARARTSDLNEDLGQIKYIFSDKTGTLTQNIMLFKRCTIAGDVFGGDFESNEEFDGTSLLGAISDTFSNLSFDPQDQQEVVYIQDRDVSSADTIPPQTLSYNEVLSEFVQVMAVCHTVLPQVNDETKEISYLGSSPDETALVKGAIEMHHKLIARTPTSVVVDVRGSQQEYTLLNVMEFTSSRKRMSVIVRAPDGTLKLYCKGAENVICERLSDKSRYLEVTMEHLENFALQGWRTLCIAMANIDPDYYSEWSEIFEEANTSVIDREKKLDHAASLIERDLVLLGATAVEDKLQDGVPQAIDTLSRAGMKIWVLTGDKQETAINIGYSCKLLLTEMDLIIVNAKTLKAVRSCLDLSKDELEERLSKNNPVGLVIDGESLHYALSPECSQDFLQLAMRCQAVLCCRVSPVQKSDIVKLVKNNCKSLTLAIGDGANDVKMIQTAHVGIGISGWEGMQAEAASDYSIAQFRFLVKLLLVHGSWSYFRTCKTIKYSFYKNITITITNFVYQFFNGFSGQVLFDPWAITFYNVLFTCCPPMAIGLWDRSCTARSLMRFPSLYQESLDGTWLTAKSFWLSIVNSIYHSLVIFGMTLCLNNGDTVDGEGKSGGYMYLGYFLLSYIVVTVNLKSVVWTTKWTWQTHVAGWTGIVAWLLFLIAENYVYGITGFAPGAIGMYVHVYSYLLFWVGLVTIPPTALLLDMVLEAVRSECYTTFRDAVLDIERNHLEDQIDDEDDEDGIYTSPRLSPKSLSKKRIGQSNAVSCNEAISDVEIKLSKDSSLEEYEEVHLGYAFSQDETEQISQTEFILFPKLRPPRRQPLRSPLGINPKIDDPVQAALLKLSMWSSNDSTVPPLQLEHQWPQQPSF